MKQLDTIGIIIKKEKLASYESNVPLQEMILEDLAPFPGYYDSFQVPIPEKELLPNHLFFVARGMDYLNDDEFIRNTTRIRENTGWEFNAVQGQLLLFNKTHPCIRINTSQLGIVPELIEAYKNTGLEFIRWKRIKPYESIIKIRTFYQLDEVHEGIYHHRTRPELHFITIPFMPPWETFEEISLLIRMNSDYKRYDAALAAAYSADGMIDMVRIYDIACTLEQLQDLQLKYHREMKRELHK
ncbi:MAG: hypothetical protein PHD61_00125 [Bacteroidales bacterium]|nr:hypothetical protein [Lentimicrobiaceae bacterium]MDD5693699.1 hypothetical protein [Bacteroidales bacterium]